MKPLLERKRRARINSYLDELKDLMVDALQAEGETITKLEKADVLELTLKHLRKLKREQSLQINPTIDADRYRAGYSACASEVRRFMSSIGHHIEPALGTQLISHLGNGPCMENPMLHSSSSTGSDCGYNSGSESIPSPDYSERTRRQSESSSVWRPF